MRDEEKMPRPGGQDDEGDEAPVSALRAPAIPIHPARWLFRSFVGGGGTVVVGALFQSLALHGASPVGALALSGATFAWIGLHGLRTGSGLQWVNAAQNQASMGRFDLARSLLDRAEKSHGNSVVRRSALVVRASIALEQGDTDAALAYADRALALGSTFLTSQVAWVSELSALAIRAYGRAVTGDEKGSREDKLRIDELTKAKPPRFTEAVPSLLGISGVRSLREVLARAELSTLVLLAHVGDKAELRAHLERHRVLLDEGTAPRERALVRGFARMLAAPSSTAYRRAESPRRSNESFEDEDWVERMLPEVAPFVRAPEVLSATDEATTALPATGVRRAAPIDWGPVRRIAMGVGVWVLLVSVIGALWVATGQTHAPTPNIGLVALSLALPIGFVLLLIGFSLMRMASVVKRRRRLFDDLFEAARSSNPEAVLRSLETNAHRSDPLLSGEALLALAQQKNLIGDFEEAAHFATQAISRLERRLMRAVASAALLPALETERALAHAALGRIDDAVREVELLTEDYACRARSIFSVKLVALAHEGAFTEALELIETSQVNAPLDRPIEVLADLVRATQSSTGLGLADRQRLDADLRDEAVRSWLQKATPLALVAFEASESRESEPRTGTRVVLDTDIETKADLEGLVEQRAEDEMTSDGEGREAPRFSRLRPE